MLEIQDLTYRIGERLLLAKASARIGERQRVGLVGRNGTGKTTLIRLILGDLAPESGDLRLRSGTRLGYLPQEAPGGMMSVREYVLAADRERADLLLRAEQEHDLARLAELHARLQLLGADAQPARAASILSGLGFDEEQQSRPLSDYSGGWRMRAALAAQLFLAPSLLILDEPSNHLDFEATLWLVDFLRAYPATLLLVSHDRDLLNSVTNHILHIDNGKLSLYAGNYDSFEQQRRARLEQSEKMRSRQEAQRQHLQAFIDRFRAKASKAKQAQSRLKMLQKLTPIAAVVEEDGVAFQFPSPEPLAPPLMQGEAVDLGYQPGQIILRRLDFRIDAEDRIALLGRNGNGKSTFAKSLAGRLDPQQGTVKRQKKLRIGYFGQHQIEELDPERNGIAHLAALLPDLTLTELRSRLAAFGLTQARAETAAEQLSGGEKARLVFALITAARPHLLILDEPTNHLDIDTREALIQALAEYPGAVVLISHDRHLIEATADQLWLVEGKGIKTFDGDIETYRQYLAAQSRESGRSEAPLTAKGETSRKEERRAEAARRAELAPLRKTAQQAASELDQLHEEIAKSQKILADPALYEGDKNALTRQIERQAALQRALQVAEERWLAAEEALNAAERSL